MTRKEATKLIDDVFIDYVRVSIEVVNDIEHLIFKKTVSDVYIVIKHLPYEQCEISPIFVSVGDCQTWISNTNNI